MGINGQAINWGLANLTAPVSGTTHAVKIDVSLNNETVTVPLASLAQVIGDFRAQAMTVDNTAGTDVVTVAETVYGWSRTINAGVAQTFQFPAVQNPVFTIGTTGSVAGLVWSLYDWPAFPDAWTNSGNGAFGANVNVVNVPTVNIGNMPPEDIGNYNPASAFAVTTGGTAETVFPANSFGGMVGYPGGFAVIKNPNNAAESLFVDAVNPAETAEPGSNGTTFELQPGESFTFQPSGVAITANAVTDGHVFVAYSWGG